MSVQNENPRIPDVLRCFLFEDAATKRWVAHCLDFDIVTSGKDEDLAWSNLKSVVRLHVEHCFTHWQEAFKKRAPDEDFVRFETLSQQQPLARTDKISFKLVPPKAQFVPNFWMKGVEGEPSHAVSGSIPTIH